MKILIRDYKDCDRHGLIECIKGLTKHLIAINPFRIKRLSLNFFDGYLNKIVRDLKNNGNKIFVSEIEGVIVGYVFGIIRKQTKEDLQEFIRFKCGEIIDLYVSPKYRKKGIGSLLVKKMGDYFKKRNCQASRIIVLHTNTNARGFYKNLNYKDEAVDMYRLLDNNPPDKRI